MDKKSKGSAHSLVDLHVAVVPKAYWIEKLNYASQKVLDETISAGFVRVHPDKSVLSLRDDISKQIGSGFFSPQYVFLRHVGRCLAMVHENQETLLKARDFLPPRSELPELFILPSQPAGYHRTADKLSNGVYIANESQFFNEYDKPGGSSSPISDSSEDIALPTNVSKRKVTGRSALRQREEETIIAKEERDKSKPSDVRRRQFIKNEVSAIPDNPTEQKRNKRENNGPKDGFMRSNSLQSRESNGQSPGPQNSYIAKNRFRYSNSNGGVPDDVLHLVNVVSTKNDPPEDALLTDNLPSTDHNARTLGSENDSSENGSQQQLNVPGRHIPEHESTERVGLENFVQNDPSYDAFSPQHAIRNNSQLRRDQRSVRHSNEKPSSQERSSVENPVPRSGAMQKPKQSVRSTSTKRIAHKGDELPTRGRDVDENDQTYGSVRTKNENQQKTHQISAKRGVLIGERRPGSRTLDDDHDHNDVDRHENISNHKLRDESSTATKITSEENLRNLTENRDLLGHGKQQISPSPPNIDQIGRHLHQSNLFPSDDDYIGKENGVKPNSLYSNAYGAGNFDHSEDYEEGRGLPVSMRSLSVTSGASSSVWLSPDIPSQLNENKMSEYSGIAPRNAESLSETGGELNSNFEDGHDDEESYRTNLSAHSNNRMLVNSYDSAKSPGHFHGNESTTQGYQNERQETKFSGEIHRSDSRKVQKSSNTINETSLQKRRGMNNSAHESQNNSHFNEGGGFTSTPGKNDGQDHSDFSSHNNNSSPKDPEHNSSNSFKPILYKMPLPISSENVTGPMASRRRNDTPGVHQGNRHGQHNFHPLQMNGEDASFETYDERLGFVLPSRGTPDGTMVVHHDQEHQSEGKNFTNETFPNRRKRTLGNFSEQEDREMIIGMSRGSIRSTPNGLKYPHLQLENNQHAQRDAVPDDRKLELLQELQRAREQRTYFEELRQEIMKKAKEVASQITRKRGGAKDVWKRRYYDEKKKTASLEEIYGRLRNQRDSVDMNPVENPQSHASKNKNATLSYRDERPSFKNNSKIEARRRLLSISDLKKKLAEAKAKLAAEMKMRHETENEVKFARQGLLNKKIQSHLAYRRINHLKELNRASRNLTMKNHALTYQEYRK